MDWHEGVAKKFHLRKTRQFQLALEHVMRCHKSRFAPGCFPDDWWCAESDAEKEEDEEEEEEVRFV